METGGRTVDAMRTLRRLLIVDDHPLVRESLELLLTAQRNDIEVVYSGPSLKEALAAMGDQPVDCAVLDLDLGDDVSPVDNTRALVEAGCPVLIVSAISNPAIIRAALNAGALGFMSKQNPSDQFLDAVSDILEGRATPASDEAETPVDLTERERTAMVLYASGLKLDSVARRMGVKPSTAQEFIKRVREKYLRRGIHLATKTDMYRVARDEGFLT